MERSPVGPGERGGGRRGGFSPRSGSLRGDDAPLLFGEKLIKYVGENAVSVVTKMMGLILAVIGVQMLIQGIHGAIQAFK